MHDGMPYDPIKVKSRSRVLEAASTGVDRQSHMRLIYGRPME